MVKSTHTFVDMCLSNILSYQVGQYFAQLDNQNIGETLSTNIFVDLTNIYLGEYISMCTQVISEIIIYFWRLPVRLNSIQNIKAI